MSGLSGMVTFTLKGGRAKTTGFIRKLEVIALAESLGGVESLINQPAVMIYHSLAKEERERLGLLILCLGYLLESRFMRICRQIWSKPCRLQEGWSSLKYLICISVL